MALRGVLKGSKPYWVDGAILTFIIFLLAIGSYERNKLWNDEVALWSDCIRKSPLKDRPNSNLGFAYLNAGDYDRALEWTKKALVINPQYSLAYLNLGIIFHKRGDLKKAIEMGKKALEADSSLHMAHYVLGAIYFENGQYDEAIKAYQNFLNVFPSFPDAHNLLAIAYAAQKQFDKAAAEFEREIRINPNHTLAHLNLGQIYWYEFKQREKALYHLRTALILDPFLPNRAQIRRLVQALERSS